MTYPSQILMNIISPNIVPVLHTQISNVSVISVGSPSDSLSKWLSMLTINDIPMNEREVFLERFHRLIKFRIGCSDKDVEGVVPPFADVICPVFST